MSNLPQLKTLGGLRLEPNLFTQPKPLVLLSYLSLEGTQPRRHLAELFWQEGNRMKSLSMTFTRLRQGAGEVVAADSKQAWTTLKSDVREVLEALDKSDWQKASELYTGAFLEGVALEDWSSELEEWVYTTREYLAERVQYALLNLSEEAAKAQDFERVALFAERAYKLPGLAGTELTNLKRLYALLSAGQSILAPEVRKEMAEYGITLQLTREEAQKMFKQESRSPATLPVRATSFVGRDEELADMATLLNKPGVSLLTLLGPAGVGKTRLALQLAHEQHRLGAFNDGVYFVPLDALSDASLIGPTLLSHFGLTQHGKAEPLTQLTDFIADKDILLVLDNVEHLSEASSLFSTLLGKCPNLKLLVTSREKLRLEEEFLFTLGGLPYPRTLSDDAALSDAVQLFGERAGRVQPQFNAEKNLPDVLRICGLVEGLPLGLELAASWVRFMPCQDIAAELERGLELLSSASKNVPERHRSLRAAFDSSWQRLSAKEQEVLRTLSVFVGGFRREAASEVAGATIPVLASLVDKSLLRVLPDGRYDTHPLLYQFTKEKLVELGEEVQGAKARHADYFLHLVQQAEPQLRGHEQLFWFKRLDEDLDNIRAALTTLEREGEAATFLKMASCLGYFWYIRGYYNEGRSQLLKATTFTPPDSTVARALVLAANIVFIQGETVLAKTLYEQSLSVARALNDGTIAALALHGLGRVAFMRESNPSLGRSYYEEGLVLARAAADAYSTSLILASLGYLVREQGDYPLAREYFEESLKLDETTGHKLGAAENMNSLANLYLEQGERAKAVPLYEKSLEVYRAFNERRGVVQELANLGIVANQLGDARRARTLHEEALQLSRELGDKRGIVDMLVYLASDLIDLEDSAAKALLEESLVIARELGNKWQLGDALRSLADLCELQGEREAAGAYYQQCLELAQEVGDKWGLAHTSYQLGLWFLDEGDGEKAASFLGDALTTALEMQLRELVIKVLEGFARLAIAGEAFIKAAQLFGYATTLRERLEVHYNPARQRRYVFDLGLVKSNLGLGFQTHYSTGKELELTEILELVLQLPARVERPAKTVPLQTKT